MPPMHERQWSCAGRLLRLLCCALPALPSVCGNKRSASVNAVLIAVSRWPHAGHMKVKHAQIQGIWSLPDELVFRILISVPEYRPNCVVDVLPLVCKKWREILYLQGRPTIKEICLDNSMERHDKRKPISLVAVGRWYQLQQGRGLLSHPVTLRICDVDEKGSSSQDVSAFLGLLAPVLGTLHMELCFYGFHNVITSETLQSLWTCHKLRGLYLESIDDRIEAEHIEAGLQHLRELEVLSIVQQEADDLEMPPLTRNIFPTRVLRKLTNLHTINLEGQALTGSASVLSCLSQLQDLEMGNCTWDHHGSSPIVLGSCLKHLALRDVTTHSDDIEGPAVHLPSLFTWEHMLGLETLHLECYEANSNEEMPILPSSVLACTQLSWLHLERYIGLDAQPRFADLCSLKVLNLGDCTFEQPPGWVPQLPSLHDLQVTRCKMPWQQLAWKSSASALRVFSCPNSRMIKVWPSICNLTTLTYLSLTRCDLTAIDPAISNLKSLFSLRLSNNKFFPEVPQELAGLSTLTRLCLLKCGAGVAGVVHRGEKVVPKMRVTEENCRFLLHFPVLKDISLSVTEEEKAALERAGFLMKLQEGKCSAFFPHLEVCKEFISKVDVASCCA